MADFIFPSNNKTILAITLQEIFPDGHDSGFDCFYSAVYENPFAKCQMPNACVHLNHSFKAFLDESTFILERDRGRVYLGDYESRFNVSFAIWPASGLVLVNLNFNVIQMEEVQMSSCDSNPPSEIEAMRWCREKAGRSVKELESRFTLKRERMAKCCFAFGIAQLKEEVLRFEQAYEEHEKSTNHLSTNEE